MEKFNAALEYYDRALKIDDNFVYSWNNKGAALSFLSKNEEAIKSFDRAIEIDSRYVPAWVNKCEALYNLDRYEEARKCFKSSLELASAADDIANLAELSLSVKEYDQSERLIKKVIESADEDFGFVMHILRVCLIYLQGQSDKGGKALLELLNYCESGSVGYRFPWNFDTLRKTIEKSDLRKETKEQLFLLTTFLEAKTDNDRMEIVTKIRQMVR